MSFRAETVAQFSLSLQSTPQCLVQNRCIVNVLRVNEWTKLPFHCRKCKKNLSLPWEDSPFPRGQVGVQSHLGEGSETRAHSTAIAPVGSQGESKTDNLCPYA